MVALVDGVPKTLGLKELIEHYVSHQREVVIRRTQYELRRAEARAHILEGLLIALDNLDAVIALIRGSADTDAAKAGLIERFELSEIRRRRSSTCAWPGSPRWSPTRCARSTKSWPSGSPSCARSSATRPGSTR